MSGSNGLFLLLPLILLPFALGTLAVFFVLHVLPDLKALPVVGAEHVGVRVRVG